MIKNYLVNESQPNLDYNFSYSPNNWTISNSTSEISFNTSLDVLNATYNKSTWNSHDVINKPEEPSLLYVILMATVLSAIDITTLVGNMLVVLAVLTTKSLHTVTNSFIMSLAVADMLVSVFVMPLSIYMVIYNNWKFGPIVCDLWVCCDVMLCTASILNLCCISLDRYFAITRPLSYSRQRSPRLARTMIAFVWIGSVLISCPPVFGWRDKNREPNTCSLNLLLSYRIYSSMGSFFLPCFIMVFVYLRIFKVIHDREKYLRTNSNHGTTFSIQTNQIKLNQKRCSSLTKCCRPSKTPTRNQLIPNEQFSPTITTTESHVHNEQLLRANKRDFKSKFKKAHDEDNKNNKSNNIPLRKIVSERKEEEFSCNALIESNDDCNLKYIDCDNENSDGANKKQVKETNKQVDIEYQVDRKLHEQEEHQRLDNDSHFINSIDCIDKEQNVLKVNSSSSTSSNPFEKKVKEHHSTKKLSYEKREILTELNFCSKLKQTRPPKSISVDNSLAKHTNKDNLPHKFYIGSFKTGSFSKFSLEQKSKKSFKTKRASPNNLVALKLASSNSSSNLLLNKLISTKKNLNSSKNSLAHVDENKINYKKNHNNDHEYAEQEEEEEERQEQEQAREEQDVYEPKKKPNNAESNDKVEKLNSVNKKKLHTKYPMNKPSISSFGSNSIVLTINRKGNHSTNSEQMRLYKESKAAKTLAIVVGGFVLSWLPFFIMYVLEAVLPHGTITKALSDWITWLGYFNSAVNPVIYAFYSKQFRSAFLRLTFGKCQHNKPNYYNSKNFYWNKAHMTNARSNPNNAIYNSNSTIQRNLVKSVR